MANDAGSFRDPSGHVFIRGGLLLRQINPVYFSRFEKLEKSGLYKVLSDDKLLIPHRVISRTGKSIILRPQKIPFISYPYEWSFDMLKDAALLTLKIQKIALDHQMILKDASAYNIQFIGTRPVFIDTLSFDIYKETDPWIAYQQFCRHFLAPLALMSRKDLRLILLLREHIDGIPLDLASCLLPRSTLFNFSLLAHLHLHSANQKRLSDKKIDIRKYHMSKFRMLSLIQNLESVIRSLGVGKITTEWEKYYSFTNYSDASFRHKHRIVDVFIRSVRPRSVLDLGANNGRFSRLSAGKKIYTIACDIDPLAVNNCYSSHPNHPYLLPLVTDLTNPASGIGWAHTERSPFTDRFQTGLVLALALVHHLAISNNLPFAMMASWFSRLAPWLIIEFIPKDDSKVGILLQNRKDTFPDYSQRHFEKAFMKFYSIRNTHQISGSKRILYLMKRR